MGAKVVTRRGIGEDAFGANKRGEDWMLYGKLGDDAVELKLGRET
jgi:hypothetical protein